MTNTIDFDSFKYRYRALVSNQIIEQLDGQLVRIPVVFLWSLTKALLIFWFLLRSLSFTAAANQNYLCACPKWFAT